MSALTVRELQVLEFIRRHVCTVGYPPTVREIGDGVGLSSTQSVHDVLGRLVVKGAIRRDPKIPRGLALLDLVEVIL